MTMNMLFCRPAGASLLSMIRIMENSMKMFCRNDKALYELIRPGDVKNWRRRMMTLHPLWREVLVCGHQLEQLIKKTTSVSG